MIWKTADFCPNSIGSSEYICHFPSNRIIGSFSKISTCNARGGLTCYHISCESTIKFSIIGNRYGIKIDKDTHWNSSNLIYVTKWKARGCGAQCVRKTSQNLKGRSRSHSLKTWNNSKRKFKSFLYDHFIKYNYSISNVNVTAVAIITKQPGESKHDMKNRRFLSKLNSIKRIHMPFPLDLHDQIYKQRNISSVRSYIKVFSLKPDVRKKRRPHGVRRNGLSRRKQRLNRSFDDLLRVANDKGRDELLHALSSSPVSRLKPILDDADRRSLRHSDWLKLKMIMDFSFDKPFPRIPPLPPKHSLSKLNLFIKGFA